MNENMGMKLCVWLKIWEIDSEKKKSPSLLPKSQ